MMPSFTKVDRAGKPLRSHSINGLKLFCRACLGGNTTGWLPARLRRTDSAFPKNRVGIFWGKRGLMRPLLCSCPLSLRPKQAWTVQTFKLTGFLFAPVRFLRNCPEGILDRSRWSRSAPPVMRRKTRVGPRSGPRIPRIFDPFRVGACRVACLPVE